MAQIILFKKDMVKFLSGVLTVTRPLKKEKKYYGKEITHCPFKESLITSITQTAQCLVLKLLLYMDSLGAE